MSEEIGKRKMICIVCPLGCELEAEIDGESGEIIDIKGSRCPKGREYAIGEITDPRRILMTIVKVRGGRLPIVSVKTAEPIPKGKLLDASMAVSQIVVDAPVMVGDIIVDNLLGTGVSVIATNNVHKSSL